MSASEYLYYPVNPWPRSPSIAHLSLRWCARRFKYDAHSGFHTSSSSEQLVNTRNQLRARRLLSITVYDRYTCTHIVTNVGFCCFVAPYPVNVILNPSSPQLCELVRVIVRGTIILI